MPDPKWKFRPMVKGEMNADPIESEFFSVEHLDSVADALVRESIQNSLDARLAGQTVSVAFRLYTEKSNRSRKMAQYLEGLHPHLNAEQNGLVEAPGSDYPESFLAIEDYGTRGLEGDPTQDDDLQSASEINKNDFFYFWRNVGRSKKSSADRGRWGLGKTVFQATSKINTYFGVTVRKSDKKRMLLGQSVLKTHSVRGVKHSPYGWYGIFGECFASPVEDRSHLDKFMADFGLKRQWKTGLSIVIPYPDPSVKLKTLLSSALIHYFFPILSDDLVVELNEDKKGLIINQKLDKLLKHVDFSASRMTKETFQSLFSFTRWIHSLTSDDLTKINEPSISAAPKWEESLFDQETLSTLREEFNGKNRIAIRVPLTIKPKDKDSEKTYFDIFIEHDEKLNRAEDHFIREGITITGVSTLKERGIRAVISIKDKALSALLGDAENPAHTEWQERSPKFKGRHIHGASCLRFVKNSPREIVKILNKQSLGIDKNLLENIFSITPVSKKGAKNSSEGDKDSLPDDLMGTTKEFSLMRRKGGFLLRKNPDAAQIPESVLVTVAYEIRGKNPFKIYNPFDFEMDKAPIKMKMKGVQAQVNDVQKNQLTAQINDQNFQLEILGFDSNRDLRVKVETG